MARVLFNTSKIGFDIFTVEARKSQLPAMQNALNNVNGIDIPDQDVPPLEEAVAAVMMVLSGQPVENPLVVQNYFPNQPCAPQAPFPMEPIPQTPSEWAMNAAVALLRLHRATAGTSAGLSDEQVVVLVGAAYTQRSGY